MGGVKDIFFTQTVAHVHVGTSFLSSGRLGHAPLIADVIQEPAPRPWKAPNATRSPE